MTRRRIDTLVTEGVTGSDTLRSGHARYVSEEGTNRRSLVGRIPTGVPDGRWLPGAGGSGPRPPTGAGAASRERDPGGWVQLGVVVFLGGLYAVSPKTVPADRIAPVPWALAGYLSFTLLRLAGAHHRVLPAWLTALSCIADVGLLLVLIWTFHVQYAQPAAFVLKAPTLFYVFIFIALRALLLEPRQATINGLTAAAGWLAVVGAVIVSDTRSGLVTRDYVEYLTSSRLLIGAELDKVVTILLVTALVALAMRRARTFLLRAIAEEARAQDLARFFAPIVAEQITAGEIELVCRGGARRVRRRSSTSTSATAPA